MLHIKFKMYYGIFLNLNTLFWLQYEQISDYKNYFLKILFPIAKINIGKPIFFRIKFDKKV